MKLVPSKKIYADLSSGVLLKNLKPEVLNIVKDALTFDNPMYETTKKFSRYNSTSVSPSLFYYDQKGSSVKVPIGFMSILKGSFQIVVKEDTRNRVEVKYPKFVLELRDDQKEAFDNYVTLNRSETKLKGLIQLPTGKGKSILGLALAHHYKAKTLIIVHKDDLVKVWQDDIKLSFNNQVTNGLIKAGKKNIGNQITIATIQTLNRLDKDYLMWLLNQFSFVINDECHHAPSSTFGMVDKFNARYKLGLTATPERKDGLSHILKLYFGDFSYVYTYHADDTDILPVTVIRKSFSLPYDPLCIECVNKNGDSYYRLAKEKELHLDELIPISQIYFEDRPRLSFQDIDNMVLTNADVVKDIVSDIVREQKKGHSCVVFFTQKEQCNIYYEEIMKFTDKVQIYNGDTKKASTLIDRASKERDLITLTTYSKSSEGTNVKLWEVGFLVSSIASGKNVEQAVGRIRRASKGKLESAILYDYRFPNVYMIKNHGSSRDQRYRKLKFNSSEKGIPDKGKTSIFKRGL